MKKAGKWIFLILFGLVAGAAVFLGLTARWAFSTWADLKMEEIVFELQAPLEGTGNGMVGEGILKIILPTALFLIAVFVLLYFVRKKAPRVYIPLCGILTALFSCLLLVVLYRTDKKLEFTEWLRSESQSSTFIEEHYVDPASAEITFPEKKKNLIMLYLESMEVTSAGKENGGAFESCFIPELVELAKENEDFSGASEKLNGGIALPGTTWTMGAMFGTTSGLPLKVSVGGNNMSQQGSFFPGICALGDILAGEGYRQRLLIGSDATFGGRRLYYRDHGGFEMEDYLYAQETGRIPLGYKVFWGFEDEKLFSYAKETLRELAASGEPFNYTILTVDTHFPGGYQCGLCKDEFDFRYGNVMACSSRQVAEFVEWLGEQDFYEDTAVVIVGDHPTMDTEYEALIPKKYRRKVYTCFLNSFAEVQDPENTRLYSTFDIFPTALAAIGCGIEGDRLGLGTNLFSESPTLLEEYSLKTVRKELKKKSLFLRQLEKVDLNVFASTVHADVRCTAYDAASGEMELLIENISGLSAPLSLAEAAFTGGDGQLVDEAQTGTVQADGSCLLTLKVPEEEIMEGALSAFLTDSAGTRTVILEDRTNVLLKSEDDPALYAEALRLAAESGNYTVLAAVRNDGGTFVSEEMAEAFSSLGLTIPLSGNYAAVLSPEGIKEKSGGEAVTLETVLPKGKSCVLISDAAGDTPTADILVDGKNCVKGGPGLQIALYDNRTGSVLQQARFRPEAYQEDEGSCEVSLEGKLKVFGRIHIRVSDISLPKEESGCVAVYWYEDHPENMQTVQLTPGDNGDYTGVLSGRIFAGSSLQVRIHFPAADGTGTWYHPALKGVTAI